MSSHHAVTLNLCNVIYQLYLNKAGKNPIYCKDSKNSTNNSADA